MTRACIGIAGVDDHGANALARSQVLAADLNWCGTKTVLSEHAGHTGPFVDQDDGEVFAVDFANAGFGNTHAHTGHRREVGGIGGG